MTNEELKKKIVEIIQSVDFYDGLLYRYCIDIATADKLADALIAAGIGDTTNLTVENEVLQRDVDNLTRTLEEGTEEFKAEKHRAEVAERALQIVVNEYRCEECPLKVCDDSICIGLIIEKYKKQAEKELAEEGEDESISSM